MPPRRHVREREHAIYCLEALGFQLAAVSFFLSPTLWIFVVRCATLLTFAHPRDIDEDRTLGRWLLMVLFFNTGGPLIHAVYGAEENTAFMLDFVGLGYRPNKLSLLCLDALYLALQSIIVCIAYETDVGRGTPDHAPDLLTPISTLNTSDSDPSLSEGDDTPNKYSPVSAAPPYILDLRLDAILHRIRHPPAANPRPGIQTDTAGLPLPNTARVQALRAVLARRAAQRRAREQREPTGTQTLPGGTEPMDGLS